MSEGMAELKDQLAALEQKHAAEASNLRERGEQAHAAAARLIAELRAEVVELKQHISELEKSLENARKEVENVHASCASAAEAELMEWQQVMGTTIPNVARGALEQARKERDEALADNAAQEVELRSALSAMGEVDDSSAPADLVRAEDRIRAFLARPHPGAALLEILNTIRQYRHKDEPDELTTLRRLLEERSRIAHMVDAEVHRKALARVENEGLEKAAQRCIEACPGVALEACPCDACVLARSIRALREPEEGGQP